MKKIVFTVAAISLLSACSYDLPKCDSSEAKSTLKQIFAERVGNGTDFAFSLSDVKELAFNKEKGIRVCKAKFDIFGENDYGTYRISWQDKEKGEYYVEILR